VNIDPVPGKVVGSAGEFSWGGAASTAFWVDPLEELTVSFFTQLLPSSTHRIRPQLRQLVYQALIDWPRSPTGGTAGPGPPGGGPGGPRAGRGRGGGAPPPAPGSPAGRAHRLPARPGPACPP